MWSEVFSADMFETRFKKEGLLNEATGLSYRREIISRGGSIDAELMIKVNKQQATETERTTGMNASDVLAFMSAHPLLFVPSIVCICLVSPSPQNFLGREPTDTAFLRSKGLDA
jgi:Zn-dependent oligopeptidase